MRAAAFIARGVDGKLIAVPCERPSEALALLSDARKSGAVGKVKVTHGVVISSEHVGPLAKFATSRSVRPAS